MNQFKSHNLSNLYPLNNAKYKLGKEKYKT